MESIRSSYDQDSLESALIDWIYLGRFVGYRSIEWCQTKMTVYHKINHPNWTGPESYAYIGGDFELFNNNKELITDLTNITIDDILYVNIRFRKQKNDQHYEIVPYYKDFQNPTFCAVHAAFRIRLRAHRLKVPLMEPIAVFHCSTGKYSGQRCFITNSHVADFLQVVAQKVFKIKKGDPSLARWSAHSIRVTACNLLHRQGFSDSYIQTRLRWRSKAFLDYLRNTLYAAAAHTKALHIPSNNLPTLSKEYKSVTLPTGDVVVTNSPSGPPLTRYREQEEIEGVLHAGAA